jgi:nucleotide-binding universal stress UspA family protein
MDQDRRVVVGVDGSMASLAALRWAGRESGLRQARLHVVYVMDPGRVRAAPYAGCARRSAAEAENAQPRAAWLQDLVGTVLGDSPLVPVDTEAVAGLAAKVLISYAAGADLLVLGDPATSQHDVIGPVARACLRHAPCPVVVVSAEMNKPVPA